VGQASRLKSSGGFRVLIAGGGVAGLETMLALRDLAGDLVDLELLSPEPHFWYRPLSVAEPFDVAHVQRFELGAIAEAAGASFTLGGVALVDADSRRVVTSTGTELTYDVLVVACGTRAMPTLRTALTFRGPSDVDRVRALLAEIEAGSAKRIAFTLPRHAGWPLPLYELALLVGTHVQTHGIHGVDLSLVTHEPSPLAALGRAASAAVSEVLRERQIALYTERYPLSFENGRLELVPADSLTADRVVALARLEGQRIPGIPHDGDGFIATDRSGRVEELEDAYAAGDITRFPIKQGGIAAQQAVHVAEAIAARAGADVTQQPFQPVLHALLLTGREPLHLRAEITVGSAGTTEVAAEPLFWPPAKIASHYLAPFLAALDRRAALMR
jgi:sulfide:quinone oxidoreductase